MEKIEILNQEPDLALIQKARKVIVEKDAAILAEAKMARCDCLITLDRKHFFTPKATRFLRPKRILTPKMLFDTLDSKDSTDDN